MILGIGIDIIEVARIASSYERFGDRFLNRILHPNEISYCLSHKAPGPFLAARFAAKEAVSKAFGTGIGSSIGWHDIEVRHHPSGQPYISLHGKGAELMTAKKANVLHISLTHAASSAIAVAILEHVSH